MGWEKLNAYIAQLPGGLSAYPQCETKAASLLIGLEMYPFASDEGLPEALKKTLHSANDPAAWIPSTHLYAMLLAQADVHGLDDAGLRQYAYESNRRMASSALYRALFSMISARTVAKMAASTWRFFNRGHSMTYEPDGDGFQLILSYPAGMVDPAIAKASAGTFEGVLSAARVEELSVEMIAHDRTSARYRVKMTSPTL